MNEAIVCDKPFVAPRAAGVGAAERMKRKIVLKDISMIVASTTPIHVRNHNLHGYEKSVSMVVAILIATGNNTQSGKKAQTEA